MAPVDPNFTMNIYLCGVGGQGIGLLSEVLIRSCIEAGYPVKGVDTHGLAQRGGIVASQVKIGRRLFTPRITPGEADLIISLERLEAFRAVVNMLRPGGTVIYYDTEYQPITVRMGQSQYPENDELAAAVSARRGRLERVHVEDLPDARMQNTALLGRLSSMNVIPGVSAEIIEHNLRAVLNPAVLESNLEVFERCSLAPAEAGG
jgi:indolepyruvate ferredoxin oxidoreductase beta subunit